MSDTFEFIDAEYATRTTTNAATPAPSVIQMCLWLGVSRSGFYEWRDRPASATATRRGELAALVVRSFTASDGTYGYRRVHADLAAWGRPCGLELVRALMREQGLEPCQPRPWRHALTEPDQTPAAIPDLLDRDFTADAPGTKMVGDITYIPTWEGWLYLATVLDCHTKAVIGWAMDDNYRTGLIDTAITMAARNHQLTDGAIFHSDRGSNYTSAQFAATLNRLGIRQSVGRTGICYDNAMAESFFAALKNERVHRTAYPTREHARRDITRYIELRYNTTRRHSALDYRTPRRIPEKAARRVNKLNSDCPDSTGYITLTPGCQRSRSRSG
ncbi:integrase catalytic subunit [Candidatus Protofrankia californiensis]|uniref:Integrase catalytic subunit n=1 Tax=Candidatus Protofrankia californiensis TaxID=1839754 RepID=A0A1C3PB47_9ACTN|nr:integrase catalytic subunit [Candidatus Protofrankia californiensis]